MSRPTLMAHDGGWRSKLLRLWQRWEAIALEYTYFHSDDVGETKGEIELPYWPWRPICWVQGHQPYNAQHRPDNYCIVCRKHLG